MEIKGFDIETSPNPADNNFEYHTEDVRVFWTFRDKESLDTRNEIGGTRFREICNGRIKKKWR